MKTIIRNGIITQLTATAGALMLINQCGLIDGWFAPNMARLTESNATVSLTLSEASWLASYMKLGKLSSVIIVPILVELAGSRKAVLYAFIPVAVSWILTILAKSVICMYIARFLSGITIGLAFGMYAIYLGEISASNLRGTFNSITMIGWPLGTLISTVSENYLPEVLSCTIYLVPCFLGMCLFAWLPESPYQLVKNKNLTEARESLAWYRGNSDTHMEMEEIIKFVESTNRETFVEKLKQFKSRPIFKAVTLVTLFSIYPQLCGVFNIIFYMQIILTNAKSYLLNPQEVVIFTNVILLMISIIAFNVVDKLGRRIVLLISSVLTTIALIGLGLHYYILKYTDLNPVQELPIAAITTVLLVYAIGISPVSGTLLGELFPIGIKSIAVTIATFISSVGGFVTTKTYQPLVNSIGETYVFWTYAVFAASAIPIVLFLLPETKGKSLQEVQNILNKK